MAEYISREEAIDKMRSLKSKFRAKNDWDSGYDTAIAEAFEHIKRVPAADVQSVKHGRWLGHHAIWIDQPKIEGWFVQAKCSECEKWAHVMNPYTKSVDYECCPHCSARMDGDAEC